MGEVLSFGRIVAWGIDTFAFFVPFILDEDQLVANVLIHCHFLHPFWGFNVLYLIGKW